jgi:cytochrome c oxidase subunit II
MAAAPDTATTPPPDESHDGRFVVIAWLVLSAIATPLVAIYLGPIIPPGNASVQGQGQVFDNQVMTALVTPIVCLLLVYFIYTLATFRARRGALVDGPPLREDRQIQILWIVITSAMVLFLAGFGTYELLKDGSGGGQGPNAIAYPPNHKSAFQVQVIGQQWQFTYRYPSLGGMESNQLVLPANSVVELHVTSLDVVHSFWAVELGVKADANPGVDNVAYVETRDPLVFHVRCAELCGLWHGYMFNNGRIVDASAFKAWAVQARAIYAPIARYVPPYALTYFPDPQRRAG